MLLCWQMANTTHRELAGATSCGLFSRRHSILRQRTPDVSDSKRIWAFAKPRNNLKNTPNNPRNTQNNLRIRHPDKPISPARELPRRPIAMLLAVMEPMMTGLGGDFFVIYWDSKTGKPTGLNSSGPAPKGLSPAERRHVACLSQDSGAVSVIVMLLRGASRPEIRNAIRRGLSQGEHGPSS
jgi:Gamma-glutamyltranspeptidase